jgi:protein-S-isoprenylcysteine O-methyltransferase Ste14
MDSWHVTFFSDSRNPSHALRRSVLPAFLPGISAAGTSVGGSARSTAVVRTGPYRFSRNPIYLAFILFVLGLPDWLNDAWLLVTLVPAVGGISMVVIPREERFLESNFKEDYLRYKATVRRWL